MITEANYFSREAEEQYMSVSQYKSFAGCAGLKGCEAKAVAKINGEWVDEVNTAMMVGSYVDAYYEGTLDRFKKTHPEIYKKDGDMKADYIQADRIIERSLKDKMFQGFMSGEKQVIMEGKLFGSKWKIKMDSYIPDKAIVDLKVMQQVFDADRKNEPVSIWTRDLGYVDFIKWWGYDIQGAIYQEIVYQNTGKRLPFFIAALDKQKETGMGVFHVDNQALREALAEVESNMPRILDIKAGMEKPDRCECCDYCRHTKVLDEVIHIYGGYEGKRE